jgi:ribosomal protein S18 acetylase RimI-like enzyme
MSLRLRSLRDDELPAFVAHNRVAYERDLATQAGMAQDQARAKAERDMTRLFPDGGVAPGNELYAIEDESGERVGDLWIAERDNDAGEPSLFVYAIEIAPDRRGRGYGKEAMLLVEDEARRREIAEANLMVFGGNDVARSLYRSLGYVEQAVFMSKSL